VYAPSLGIPSGSSNDGGAGCCWSDLYGGNASRLCQWWVDGTSPNRRFIVMWAFWNHYSATTGTMFMQEQFYENGTIRFSYSNSTAGSTATTWDSNTYYVCLDQPGSSNYITPNGTTSSYTFATPPNDWQFVPPVKISGSVFYDRYVVDANGIGNTSELGLPLANMRIEQRDAGGVMQAFGTTDANGKYSFSGVLGVPGNLVVAASSTAAAVRATATGPLLAATITASTFSKDTDYGVVTIGESNDPGGINRAAINIARTMQTEYDWARLRSSDAIPGVNVLYNTSSSAPTSYTAKSGIVPATIVISGASSNPDGWDVDVIRKVYARTVLAAIAAEPGTAANLAWDTPTSDLNAFAEAFGYYMASIMSGSGSYYDGVNKTTTITTNLEAPTPAPTSAKSSAVAAWAAAALYDLVDGTGTENWDSVNGVGLAGENVFRAADGLTVPVTGTNFLATWVSKGYDAVGATRDFIYHGLVPDDADELNDNAAESKYVAQFGFVRPNRVLNANNEDWYEFTMPQPTTSLIAQVVFDRFAQPNAVVTLEIQSTTGTVIATGSVTGTLDPYTARTGALPAANYRVRVAPKSGAPIPNYTVQVYSKLEFSSPAFPSWTVNRPYNVPVNIKGGVPPYILTIDETHYTKPRGVVLDGINARVTGTPAEARYYDFLLQAKDAANPQNQSAGRVTFLVNGELNLRYQKYAAFAFDKEISQKAAYTGGTAPYTATVTTGALPHNVQFADGELRYTGHPDLPGSFHFGLKAADVAGSFDTDDITGVVCVPFGTTTLGAGESAAGFYFDAVEGSTVNINVKTVARQPKRVLTPVLFDTNGATPIESARVRGGNGKAGLSNFVVPVTGRYYFVVGTTGEGEGTQLVATGKVTGQRGDSGNSGDAIFSAGQTLIVDVGALAGAEMTFTVRPGNSDIRPLALYMYDPNGQVVHFENGEATYASNGTVTIKKTLPTSGTWLVYIGANNGTQGRFNYSFKLAQPHDVVYSDD
jgi:hypothetical protein